MHWWILGLALLAGALTFVSPWAFALQLALLGVACFLLARRPTRSQSLALIGAVVILVVAMIAIAASAVAVVDLQQDFGGTSVPVESP